MIIVRFIQYGSTSRIDILDVFYHIHIYPDYLEEGYVIKHSRRKMRDTSVKKYLNLFKK